MYSIRQAITYKQTISVLKQTLEEDVSSVAFRQITLLKRTKFQYIMQTLGHRVASAEMDSFNGFEHVRTLLRYGETAARCSTVVVAKIR